MTELHEVQPSPLGDGGVLLMVNYDAITRESRETHNDIHKETRCVMPLNLFLYSPSFSIAIHAHSTITILSLSIPLLLIPFPSY